MSDTGLTIKIGSTADTKGFDQATEGLHRSTEAAHEFVNALKLGVGIDLGGKLVESIREIPHLLREAVAEGVKFNALMQTSQIAMAGAFKSVDSSLSFDAAKKQGGEALDYLMQKSKALGLDFESVVETFKVNVPTMFQAGIHDAKEMADTIVLLNQVAASKGISGFQAQRDIIDLLNGQGERTILGKELKANGVTNEQLEKWKEQGVLAEMLREKFAAIAEAGQAFADTYDGNLNRLKTTWSQLLGELSKPVFEELQQAFKELAAELDSPEGKQGLKQLGIEIKDLVHDGVALTEWAAKNADTLVMFGEALKVIGITVASVKFVDLLAGLSAMPLKLIAGTDALKAQTAALKEHTTAMSNDSAAGAGSGVGSAAGGSVATKAGKGVSSIAAKALGAIPQIALAIEVGVMLSNAVNAFDKSVWNPFTSWNLGKMTSDDDVERAGEIQKDDSVQKLQKKSRGVTNSEDYKKTGQEILNLQESYEKQLMSLTGASDMTREALKQQIQLTELLLKEHQKQDHTDWHKNAAAKAAHDKELNDKAAAEKQAAEEEENRKANAKHEEARKERDAEREARLANELADAQAKSASERGEYSTYASDRAEQLKKQLAATPSLRDEESWEGKYTAAEVDKRDKLRAALEADIKQMAKAQQQADMETWKERDRREQELSRKKVDALKEQERLEQAQADKKLAQIESSGAKEQDIAAQRKQVEDEIARKRLDIQNQIGALEGESAISRLTRQTEFEAKQISRSIALQKDRPTDLSRSTVERDNDGNITRVIPLSDPGKQQSVVASERTGYWEAKPFSRLEAWKARQSPEWQAQEDARLAASSQPQLPPPANNPAMTSTAGTASASGGNPNAFSDPSKKVDDLTKAIGEKLKTLETSLSRATESTKSAGDAVVKAGSSAESAASNLTKKISELAARLERLERA